MQFTSKEQKEQFRCGIQDLEIEIIGKNLIKINGDVLRVRHNYGSHYGLKSVDTMNKKQKETLLAYGDEDINRYNWMKKNNYNVELNYTTIQTLKDFIKNSSNNPLDTYNILIDIDEKFNINTISTIEDNLIPTSLNVINDLTKENKLITVGKIAYSVQDLEGFIISVFKKKKKP